jgi:mitotic spindle assembly checkpoint protein MAD1
LPSPLSKDLSTLNAELQLKTKELEVVQRQIDILKQGLISGGVSEDIIRSVAEVRSTAPAMDAEDSLMIDSQAPKQRILQLKDNPASREQAIRQSMLDDLRKENKELITRLQHGQDGSAMDDLEPSTIIPEQIFINLLAENERIANTVAQKEKRILRMQQVWVAKVREYHEAVASLLGYKVDFSADGMVRLASMYADPNDISFVFKSSENDQGTLKIVGANKDMYMKTLESSYNYCVLERGSIPAFLSAVTMELID